VTFVIFLQSFTLFALALILWCVGFLILTTGRLIVSTQDSIDNIVAQLSKANREVIAKIADVQAQLDAANVPAEKVDLTALAAAAQALDDIVADEPPFV